MYIFENEVGNRVFVAKTVKTGEWRKLYKYEIYVWCKSFSRCWMWTSLYFGMWRLTVRWVSLRTTISGESASTLFSVEDGESRFLRNIVRYVSIRICTLVRFTKCIIHYLYQILLRKSYNWDGKRRNMPNAWGDDKYMHRTLDIWRPLEDWGVERNVN